MANSDAIAKAEELLAKLKADDGSPQSRARVLRQVEEIRITVQQPPDAVTFYVNKTLILIMLNACVELGVFEAIPIGSNASADEIATKVGIDASIISRFLRALVLEGFFAPVPSSDTDTSRSTRYTHTPASISLHGPDNSAFIRAALTYPVSRYWNLSAYLRSHTLSQTQDPLRSAFAWSYGLEGQGFFDVLEQDKTFAPLWKTAMRLTARWQVILAKGMFPWKTLQKQVEADPGRAFVVDVGGGAGNALVEIRKECGGSYGAEMVLEDLAFTLEGENPVRIEGVRNLVYDFFKEREQPVKNAHVYYLRKVMHDYYDDKCRQILRQVVDAMAPTSRVILCEYILPDANDDLGTDIFPYLMDFLLFMAGGIERTESQWRRLLDSVGLEIVAIWRSEENPIQADIEARLKSA